MLLSVLGQNGHAQARIIVENETNGCIPFV